MTLFDWQGGPGHLGARLYRDTGEVAAPIEAPYEVTHNTFYATFLQFAEAMDDFFARRLLGEWKIWRDTLTDSFRVVSHQDFRVLE